MKIKFRYNIIQDYLRGIDTFTRRKSYLNARSVVKFSLFLPIKTFFLQRKILSNVKSLWNIYKDQILQLLKKNEIGTNIGEITVFVVTLGVEGKYNEFSRKIWARYYKCGGEIEFLKTIIHELIHIYYADNKIQDNKIEDKIDGVIEKIKFEKLIKKENLVKYSIGQDSLAPNQLGKL